MDPNLLMNHIGRLARLDTSVFDEVRDDAKELVPSLVVAAISCLLAGLGAFLYWQVIPAGDFSSEFVNTFILGSIFLAAMYAVMVLIVYVVLVQMYKVQVDLSALFRTMGYAAIPLALSVLMFIPAVWPVFALVPLALLFVMSIYAAQSATNADSKQVVVACAAGMTVMVLVLGFIALKMADLPDVPIGAGIFGTLLDIS
ncbi:MAG: YIP1 family protein [Tepidiformaceae bacterium]